MTKNTICGDITIERIDMSQPQRITYTMTEPEIDSDTLDDAIAVQLLMDEDVKKGEYFDSEVSPAKIGTKEVQVLMDEVA